jgi:hypothetical protein
MLHIAARRPAGRGWRYEAHRRGLDLCNIYLTTTVLYLYLCAIFARPGENSTQRVKTYRGA